MTMNTNIFAEIRLFASLLSTGRMYTKSITELVVRT